MACRDLAWIIAVTGCLLTQAPCAMAERPRTEAQASAAARALVESAGRGQFGAAFAAANALRRSDDERLARSLAAQEHEIRTKKQKMLGGAGRVLAPYELDYGGCYTREFAVRYPNKAATWVLKFRRLRDGYYLYDLYVNT